MRTVIALLSYLVVGGLSAAWASGLPSNESQPVVVNCFCLTDLTRAVKSQSVPSTVTSESTGNKRLSARYRLYRDGYRPVVYGNHHYWCRIESAPLTGSRVDGNVFCQEAQVIELDYDLGSNHL
jgi:hypothetical protein